MCGLAGGLELCALEGVGRPHHACFCICKMGTIILTDHVAFAGACARAGTVCTEHVQKRAGVSVQW